MENKDLPRLKKFRDSHSQMKDRMKRFYARSSSMRPFSSLTPCPTNLREFLGSIGLGLKRDGTMISLSVTFDKFVDEVSEIVSYILSEKKLPEKATGIVTNRFRRYIETSSTRFLQHWHGAHAMLADRLKDYLICTRTPFSGVNEEMKTFLDEIGFKLKSDGKIVKKN